MEKDAENNTIYDYSQIDYDEVYAKIIREVPSMRPIVEKARKIVPAQRGEYNRLLKIVNSGNLEEKKHAKLRIFEMGLRNALYVALSTYEKTGHNFEDVFQVACIALWRSIEAYRDDIRTHYVSFRSLCMSQDIQQHIMEDWPTCRFPLDILNNIWTYLQELEDSVGAPDLEKTTPKELYHDLVSHTSCSEKKAEKLSVAMITPAELSPRDDEFSDFSDKGECELEIHRRLLHDELMKAISCLSEQERRILVYRYGLDDGIPHSYDATAKEVGLSSGYTRLVELGALSKIRKNTPEETLVEWRGEIGRL